MERINDKTKGAADVEHDAAERKKAEDQLSFQAHILSTVHDAIIAVDENIGITYWNGMAEAITGWTAEEAVELSGREVFHRMGVDSLWPEFTSCLDADGAFAGEISALRKDGSQVIVDLHMKRIYGPSEQFLGTVSTFRDVTERKRTEEALQIKEEEMLEIIDGFTEGSWIVDRPEGTIKCSEKWARRLGLDQVPENEMLAYTRTLSHPDDTRSGNSIESCMEAGMTRFDLEYRVKTIDSGYIWTQNRGKIVYDAQGKAVKVYAATIDITERKRAEEALRESEHNFRGAVRDLAARSRRKLG